MYIQIHFGHDNNSKPLCWLVRSGLCESCVMSEMFSFPQIWDRKGVMVWEVD